MTTSDPGTPATALIQHNLDECKRVAALLEPAELATAIRELSQAARLFFVANGRSKLAASAVSMRLMHIGYESFVVGETATPAIAAKNLLIAVSSSGSGYVVHLGEIAHALGARVLAITTSATNPIAEVADVIVTIPSQNIEPPTTQYAGSLFEQAVLIVGDALCASLIERRALSFDDLDRRHANLQ